MLAGDAPTGGTGHPESLNRSAKNSASFSNPPNLVMVVTLKVADDDHIHLGYQLHH